jgi:general secretion pathway protein K
MVNRTDMTRHGIRNSRGVALLITLLVTALLIALIFEFAYGTRVSLRAAVNFRDSQRAYFLARSGMYAFAKSDDLKDSIPQGEWGVVPIVSGGDTELRIKWADEAGKIMITDVKTNQITQSIVKALFENKSIDTAVYNRMVDPTSNINNLSLLTGLHQYMNDEDFNKVSDCLTVSPVSQKGTIKININTTSADVLQALGISSGSAQQIIEDRNRTPFTLSTMPSIVKETMVPGQTMAAANCLTDQSNIYEVYSYATVGDYTKQVEVIIQKKPFTVLYWRAL